MSTAACVKRKSLAVFLPEVAINTAADITCSRVNGNCLRGGCGQTSSIQKINWKLWNVKQEQGCIHNEVEGILSMLNSTCTHSPPSHFTAVYATLSLLKTRRPLFHPLLIQGGFAAGTLWSHSRRSITSVRLDRSGVKGLNKEYFSCASEGGKSALVMLTF